MRRAYLPLVMAVAASLTASFLAFTLLTPHNAAGQSQLPAATLVPPDGSFTTSGMTIQNNLQALPSGKVLETRTIPADGTPVQSATVLASGKVYLIRVSGTWVFGGCDPFSCPGGGPEYLRWGDAAYLTDDYFHSFAAPFWSGFIYLEVNGNRLNFGSYNSNHIYSAQVTGTGTAATFRIQDCSYCYGDNAGSLRVEILDGSDGGAFALGPLNLQQRSIPAAGGTWGGDSYGIPGKDDPPNPTIAQYGCFLTDMAEIVDYWGFRSSPSFHTNPRLLNNWLRSNSGYNGLLVIPAKVAEYARKMGGVYLLGPFTRPRGTDDSLLNGRLENGTPVDLRVSVRMVDSYCQNHNLSIPCYGEHHVLAVGETTTSAGTPTWYINDPDVSSLFNLVPILKASYNYNYNNQYDLVTYAGVFSGPPQLASITLMLASPAELLVTDPLGRRTGIDVRTSVTYDEIPDAVYFDETPTNEETFTETAHPVKMFYSPAPLDGSYTIQVIGTGSGSYTLDALGYDNQGNPVTATVAGSAVSGGIDTYGMDYSSAPGSPVVLRTGNAPPTLTIPGGQTVQYSDILGFNISASDPEASDPLVLSASGLPSGLTFTDNGDRTGTVAGTAQVPAGVYPVTFSVSDGFNPPVTASLNITVTREDAIVTPSTSNPTSVKVNSAGGTAGPITLAATVTEANDDATNGNISYAQPVNFTLQPVGSGSSLSCVATTSGGGIGGTLTASCTFNSVPVNVYDVHIAVGGIYYTGAVDTVLAVYDPSLGFTTGGGTIMHNGVLANFGFNVKYLSNGNIQGQVLYIEHRMTGDVMLKGNALGSLSIVKNSSTSYSAIILGKATLNGVGNYSYQVVAIDNGEPGTSDQFGLQVKNPSVTVVTDLTFTPIALTGGNIQVPHK